MTRTSDRLATEEAFTGAVTRQAQDRVTEPASPGGLRGGTAAVPPRAAAVPQTSRPAGSQSHLPGGTSTSPLDRGRAVAGMPSPGTGAADPAAGDRLPASPGRGRTQTPADRIYTLRKLPERLAAQITIDPLTGCWLWEKTRTQGYGVVQWNGKQHQAHRVIWELLVCPIPEGLTLDHLCHSGDKDCPGGISCPHRRCANPAHLEPVTNRENILRGNSPSAKAARRTHCPQGHEYTPENTLRDPDGSRRCRQCTIMRDRKRRRHARENPRSVVRTYGIPITVRLPSDIDVAIREMATGNGVSPGEYLRQLVCAEIAKRRAIGGAA